MTNRDLESSAEDAAPVPDSPAMESPASKGPKARILLAGLLLLLLALPMGAVLSCRAGAPASQSAAPAAAPQVPAGTTAVPNCAGMPRTSAESALRAAGFVSLATAVVTSTATPDSVIAQVPDAGTGLTAGSQVAIAVAQRIPPSASPPVALPNVYGMTKAQAQSLVMSFGFAPAFAQSPSGEPKGVAIAQLPTSEDQAVPGTTVLVILSTGVAPKPASVAIPSVVGQTEAAATAALTKAQLTSQVLQGFNAAAMGSVFAQLPPSGGLVAPGTPVALAVSLGPVPNKGRDIVVPDVTRMDPPAAREAMLQAGLQVQQARVLSVQLSAGKVVGQIPPAGWTVPARSIAIVSATPTN